MIPRILYGALAALAVSPISHGLKILLGNDDGFGSANIRAFYNSLKASGHDVVLVAPIVDNSGQGGRSVFTSSATLQSEGEYGLVSAGAPSLGTDPNDSHIWYYNGLVSVDQNLQGLTNLPRRTPAACTFVGLDYVIPKVWGNGTVPDLYVGGPNVGTNLGPFLYTLSGTIGGTYAAIGRGIPGIAFSGGSLYGQRGYQQTNQTTTTGYPDPAIIYGQLSTSIVNQLVNNTKPGERILPLGYGLNVNYPSITTLTNTSCVAPKFYQTRLTGGALTDAAIFNETSRLFTYANYLGTGLNACINGDCSLPGETTVVNSGCQSSVSVFTIDYDAPSGRNQTQIRKALEPLVISNKTAENYRLSKREFEARSPLRHE